MIGEGLVIELELEGLVEIAQGLPHALALARDLDFEPAGDVPGRLVGHGSNRRISKAVRRALLFHQTRPRRHPRGKASNRPFLIDSS
jgi:hypothetical protein